MAQWQRIAIAPSQFDLPYIHLTRDQQHYLSRVLRLQSGDRFIAMDGEGQWWLARLKAPTPLDSPLNSPLNSQAWTAIVEEQLQVQTELSVAVTLIAALPKGNGFDDVVRACTELGVDRILPALSDRTLLEPSPRKIERWRRISREAAEQSERQVIPTIADPLPFPSILQSEVFPPHLYICVARGDAPHLLDCLQESPPDAFAQRLQRRIALAIGPEGGWTPEEVTAAIDAGFVPVSLGCRILRAVTAPIVALSLVAAALERAK
ncbi:MAG: 16S rRNA (uracil(1498)-N(3))-methyltransferase [Cyanobacteriota bacterium]|nr:16S rRNA (uracil(1498)-N(3))-methyltransferase [Cyanobacteriota bacterium]